MKVTEIKTFVCHCYRANWVFVKVLTDEGAYGVGEATLEMRELTVAQAVKELERDLVGKDPGDIERFWHGARRDSYWRDGPVLMSALSAVEMALWDIKGKVLGVPVYQLLGGKVRDTVPCYANGWVAGAKKPQEFAEKARAVVDMGFEYLKWDPFGSSYMHLGPQEFRAAMDCVRAVAEAVGDRALLLIEGHGRFTIQTAVRVGRALGEFNVEWFEEPIAPYDNDGLAQVKSRIDVPVAAGERLYGRWDFRDFLQGRCADVIQPDVSHAGGLMEMKKIAAMAECYDVPICPHNPSGPVANAATLQLAACVPNFYLLETMVRDVPYRRAISDERVVLTNGCMQIGDRPGLGIDIDEEKIAEHPYQRRRLRHYTGRLTESRPPDATAYYEIMNDESRS